MNANAPLQTAPAGEDGKAILTEEQKKELRIRQAASAFGQFCMAQKLSDQEFLFAVMLSLVPCLAAYPRNLEIQFKKALDGELKLHRRLLLQKQAEAGANKEAQAILDAPAGPGSGTIIDAIRLHNKEMLEAQNANAS